MQLLVLDVGSSSVRAVCYAAETLVPVASAQRVHAFETAPRGASTATADELRTLIEQCIDDVLADPRVTSLAAVAHATFVGNVVGVDGERAVTPVYTYAETRAAECLASLRERLDSAECVQRTGCPLHSAYTGARLAWLRTQGVDVARLKWIDIGSYIYRHWFGREVPMSYSAAAWSGLLNRRTLGWDEAWLSALGISAANLPPLADYREGARGLVGAYAARWPALASIPFFLAIGDGAAANVGSGAGEPGAVALTVGTTAALRTVSRGEPPAIPAGLWCYRVDAERHLLGGALSEGGNVYQWLRGTLQLGGDKAAPEPRLGEAEFGAHGLTVLPFLTGERSPGWWSDATSVIAGLRLDTSPLDIARAGLEAVALRLAVVFRALGGAARVYAGGGALHSSPAWTQIIADALGVPVYLSRDSEVTARGAALLALEALGCSNLDSLRAPECDAVFEPRAANRPRVEDALSRQRALYDSWRAISSG